MIYLGIDPGQKGGIAVLAGESQAQAWRYPGDVSSAALLVKTILKDWKGTEQVMACLEQVHAMPGQGVSSTFKFGANFGAWQGILSANEIPYIMVTPRKWQQAILDAGTGETKERSLNMARRLFPAVDMQYKADDGKADALNMALYLKKWNEK